MSDIASQFTGQIPDAYDKGLGPVFLEPHARNLAHHVSVGKGGRVLELAAGTGILTKCLSEKLGTDTAITASDLNEGMLRLMDRHVPPSVADRRVADAGDLPFDDASFDAIACQFGYMFFPDKPAASREAFRVLNPGGRFVFNVWDKKEHNEFVGTAIDIVTQMFAGHPPQFYCVPFGSYETGPIIEGLTAAGFAETIVTPVEMSCTCTDTAELAKGLIYGNPIVIELEQLGPTAVEDAFQAVKAGLRTKFGQDPIIGRTSAFVIEARKS